MNKIIDFLISAKNRRILFLFAVLLFASLYVFTYVLQYKSISTGKGGTQEEFLFEYNAAKNFAIKGFAHSFFLTDQSTDFRKESRPILYTHDPPMTSVVQGLLLKIGLNVFQSRIAYTFLSLSGIVFLYLFISEIASITAAVIVCVLLVVNFNGYLSLADSNYFAWGPFLLFGYLWARNLKSSKKYFIVPLFFLFSSLTFYTFLPFLLIIESLFFIFEKDKRLFFTSILVSIVGIFAHIAQNIIALKPALAWQDVWLTAGNRIFGVPGRQELLKFYQDHDLVLWGSHAKRTIGDCLRGSFAPFYLFKTPLIIGGVAALFLNFFRQGNVYKNRKFLFILFSAVSIWQFIVLQTVSAFPVLFHSFLAIFLGIILSDLFYVLSRQTPISFKAMAFKAVVLLALILIIFKYFIWAGLGRASNDANLASIVEDLKKYQNKTFYTNIHSHKVSFSTENWVVGSCEYDGLVNLDASKCYSKFTSLNNEELVPDYILLSPNYFAFDCPADCFSKLKNDLALKYKLVEEKDCGLIYQVKK